MKDSELTESLVALAGTAERAAGWLMLTPAAVSAARARGGLSPQSTGLAEILIARYHDRRRFALGWLMQRTTPLKGRSFKVIVEVVLYAESERPVMQSRGSVEVKKADREDYAELLAKDWLDADQYPDGDILVYRQGDRTVLVYVDLPELRPSFVRQEWEPFWPLKVYAGSRSQGPGCG